MTKHGGKRADAGCPRKPDHLRKQKRYIMLPREVWDFVDSLDDTRGGNNRELEKMCRAKMKRAKPK